MITYDEEDFNKGLQIKPKSKWKLILEAIEDTFCLLLIYILLAIACLINHLYVILVTATIIILLIEWSVYNLIKMFNKI